MNWKHLAIGAATMTMVGLTTGLSAHAQQVPATQILGTWQGQFARFTFMADGRAVGQQLSAGTVYTSFGIYRLDGDLLSVRFNSVEPPNQCGTAIGPNGLPSTRCLPATPIRPMGFRVRFEGPNRFVWGVDQPGAAIFVRVP